MTHREANDCFHYPPSDLLLETHSRNVMELLDCAEIGVILSHLPALVLAAFLNLCSPSIARILV